jgi:hypothetical protein
MIDSDKASKLFKLCVKAERDFRNENRPLLARKAVKMQHKLYWIVANDVRKEDEKGDNHLRKIERMGFELVKRALTGRLGMTIDELHNTVNLFRKKKNIVLEGTEKPSTSAKVDDSSFKLLSKSTDAIIAQ